MASHHDDYHHYSDPPACGDVSLSQDSRSLRLPCEGMIHHIMLRPEVLGEGWADAVPSRET